MDNNNFEKFQAPYIHISENESDIYDIQDKQYFRTNEQSQQLEIVDWYNSNPTEERPGPPGGGHHGPPHGPPPPGGHHGPPHGPPPPGGHFGPPHGPPPPGGHFGPPYGPPFGPPFGPPVGPPYGPPFGPPVGPPFGPPISPLGPLFPLGPIIPIPIPLGVPRPAQPNLHGKYVFVVVQGGPAYPNATATYQIQFVPGMTIYQALLSTGTIQLADNGQLLAVSGVTINEHVRYALNINGSPVYTHMLNFPLSINDIITVELVYE